MRASVVLNAIRHAGLPYREEISLKPYSTFRIGGVAALALFPRSAEELCNGIRLLRQTDTDFEIIGNGSNVLFGDGRIEKVLIFTKGLDSLTVQENRLVAFAGVSLASLAGCAAEASLTGLEFARGIPGTVGGAIFMNAGAYGGSISDVLTQSAALDTETGEILTLREHDFDYRSSIYMREKRLICFGGTFSLRSGDRACILEKMKELAIARREKQPLELPNGGSYFKRPERYFAGKLIEDCGLKGMRIGGAAVSEKHAGFLVNLGGASAEDVLCLEELVRREVLDRFGVSLEREVRLIR